MDVLLAIFGTTVAAGLIISWLFVIHGAVDKMLLILKEQDAQLKELEQQILSIRNRGNCDR